MQPATRQTTPTPMTPEKQIMRGYPLSPPHSLAASRPTLNMPPPQSTPLKGPLGMVALPAYGIRPGHREKEARMLLSGYGGGFGSCLHLYRLISRNYEPKPRAREPPSRSGCSSGGNARTGGSAGLRQHYPHAGGHPAPSTNQPTGQPISEPSLLTRGHDGAQRSQHNTSVHHAATCDANAHN